MERVTYDFCIAGKHCWQVKGADNLECGEVCKSRDNEGCNGCPNDRCVTMGSLFDGIGGFPLIWEEINGKGSCLWASEIEEFPIAVTKIRIGG